MNGEQSFPASKERDIFLEALDQPTPETRAAYLEEACGDNRALRVSVEALLCNYNDDGFLEVAALAKKQFGPVTEKSGDTIGPYKLREQIGEGGFGTVYEAEQKEPIRRLVALKIIKSGMDTKQVVARFDAERQALAFMDHPNIAKVLDAGATETGRPFFVMELVLGIRITDYCDQNHLTSKERLDLFIKVCHAIQHAHQKGIIHRDIKPSNILVTLHDGVPVPKVIDFGIAKATEGRLTDNTVYTHLNQFIGTPAYMSPEQAEMSGLDIDTRSDIYSLGVLLFELLAGSTPFDGNELISQGLDQMRKTIREKEPVRPSTRFATLQGEELTTTAKHRSTEASKLLHQLQGDLDWIVMKCLEKDRTRRYDTANGLAADLNRYLNNEPVVARPPSNLYRLQKFVRRNKLACAAAAGVALALLLGVCGLWLWIHQNQMALRQALLSQARLERRGEHSAGWSGANWALIQKAAAIRSDSEVLDQAAGTLSDLDAKLIYAFSNAPGGSAVFGPNDTLLVGGAMGSPALLIETNGVKRELPTRAEGPLCWTAEGVALQFSAPSNICLLQEVVTGQVRRRFALGEGERVNRTIRPVLAMNATGTRVAAGVNSGPGNSSRLVVWDAIGGKALGDAAVHARALAFSDDGSILAVGDTNGSVTVYSFPEMGMARLMELPPPGGPTQVHCLAMARDRLFREEGADAKSKTAWLVAASYKGGEVDIWDLQTRMPRAVCRGSKWSVTSLGFHPDGLMLATGGREGEVRFWDVMTGNLLLRIEDPTTVDARALAFNPAGTRMAWATEASPPPESSSFWKWTSKDGLEEYPRFEGSPPCVAICELSGQRGLYVLRGLTTSIHKVWFSIDGSLVAALSDNWHVAVWQPAGGRLIAIFKVPEGGFTDSAGGAFDLAGRHFAFAAGTRARLYEVATGHVAQQWTLPKSGLMDQLQFDGRGHLLLLRRGPDNEPANRRRWQLYQLPFDGEPALLHQQSETNWVPYQTAFALGGERFFVWSYEPVSLRPILRVFEVANGRQLWQATSSGIVYPSTLLDPTGRWFAYLVNNINFRLMRLSDFQDFGSLPTALSALGPIGDQFAVNGPRGLLVCGRYGAAKGLPLGSDWTRSTCPVAFSVDGRLVAWGTEQGALLVADIPEVRRRLSELGR
jgi:serine/threonine protein kinase